MFTRDSRLAALRPRGLLARLIPFILILVSLACSLPNIGRPTPTPPGATPQADAPTATVPIPTPSEPLPPALVESDPPLGAEIPLDRPITLYFNQPMDRDSVEAAFTGLNGRVSWSDDATLVFAPDAPLSPASLLNLGVEASARSARGLALTEPISLTYQTVGYLQLAQALPEPGAVEVDPTSAVVAAFNRPVVPLGAEAGTLPAAFSLADEAGNAPQGRGEWTNTSTYIFYPEPGLSGGQTYTVLFDANLRGADGSPLEAPQPWSFTTALPELLEMLPGEGGRPIRLDQDITLKFNQPMEQASVEAGFRLAGPDGAAVTGTFAWDEVGQEMTFTPEAPLARAAAYTVSLDAAVQALGGTPLGQPFSAALQTVPALSVESTTPVAGGILPAYESIALTFSGPIQPDNFRDLVSLSPAVSGLDGFWSEEERALRLFAPLEPNRPYTLTVSADLADPWGGTLGQPFTLAFRTAPLEPGLSIDGTWGEIIFLTPQDRGISAQATNIASTPLTVGSLPFTDLFRMLGPEGYPFRQDYRPADARDWEQTFSLPPDATQRVEVFVSPDQQPLAPGLYFVRLGLPSDSFSPDSYPLAVSNLQTTLKLSATDALVWAVDLRSQEPVVNAPVTVYGEDGSSLASGVTDSEGVFNADLPTQENTYGQYYAVIGQPGEETFGFAYSGWSYGIGSYDFGISNDPLGPHLKTYLYTDRPIYRPGQTVYFRLVARQAYNGRYSLPDLASLPLVVNGDQGQELSRIEVSLSGFGTGHGQFFLPDDAPPGYYSLMIPDVPEGYVSFQVAEYRKPEINLQAQFAAGQIQTGDRISATISARYFFDAPASNVKLKWVLFAKPSSFFLPTYQVGKIDTGWLEPFFRPVFGGYELGVAIATGEAEAGPDGTLTLDLPSLPEEGQMDPFSLPPPDPNARQTLTLEVTAEDESGLPVSARAALEANPAPFYIGARPDAWVARAGEAAGFEVQVVDWDQNPAGARSLRAEFSKVTWRYRDVTANRFDQSPAATAEYTPVASTDFTTSDGGEARLSFTPPEPGTYQLTLTGLQPGEEQARTELLLWVGGAGQAVWPNVPNQRLRLTADREGYRPGDTAQVFIPNPFGANTPALVTVERGSILRHQVLRLDAGGSSLDFPLTSDDAPNVFVSATLLGQDANGRPDFRQGYVELPVEPVEQVLNVSLTSDPERAGPGDEVTFNLQVTDSAGNPVEGQFSLAVVDLAVLALADPNSQEITPAFYAKQLLGVRTGLSLAGYSWRGAAQPLGNGGGGGGDFAPPSVRERFPDTALWEAEIVTGSDGTARVSVPLPDTLTTWQADLRGLTVDTRVGSAKLQVVTTQDLIIRPVTPRFLVVGDHVQLAAVVQNNTADDLQVETGLEGSGFALDDPASAAQTVSVPAGGRARVEWWGAVADVESVDLVFSASAGDLSDATRPAAGALPVLHYTARETFRTSGVMDEAGERLELVSLPRSFDPQGGELSLELSPSLAAAMITALDALENSPYDTTEQSLSRFLPNLEAYRALQDFGQGSPALQARLDRTLEDGLKTLLARQHYDGGWGWWQEDRGEASDPYLTAYVLFGLIRAREAGIQVNDTVIQRAADFLVLSLPAPDGQPGEPPQAWQLDRLVFQRFALATAGQGDLAAAQDLYDQRELMNPWARALLALTLEGIDPGSEEARTLISDLQAGASRSATGAHWELGEGSWVNMMTPLTNSAVVVYALAQRDPGSPLLADAARYLMANRGADGAWASTYASAWSLMALTEVMKGTGELGGDFGFAASLNGAPLASGQASGEEQLTPVTAQVPLNGLVADGPNALTIGREAGTGRLYYTAGLSVNRPVESVEPLAQGLNLTRSYSSLGGQAGQKVQVRLSLTVPEDMYYVVVEDYIPAGAEILDTRLKTSQQMQFDPETGEQLEPGPQFDPRDPYAEGWGWWHFGEAQIFDDHIAWAAESLPAGSYELTYTLVLLQPGEYQTLPARAWQFYFPEVQANSAGDVFEIQP